MEPATDNAALAERLAREAERAEGTRARALRRAAHAALSWPVEAAEHRAAGGRLVDLHAVGPWIARFLTEWIDRPSPLPDPPPERRGFLSRAVALRVLDDAPAWRAALQGDLQVHTDWTDGTASIREMAAAARSLGRSWIAITDHSQGLPIAHGMDEARLRRQGEEVRAAAGEIERAGSGFRLLHGLEMNLDPEGAGDMDPRDLASLDVVLGAFHSALRRRDDQTERYLAALENPHVDVLAHPRTRMWNRRRGLDADWPRVFARAAELGTAVEVDAHAHRQDLELDLLRVAAREGCTFSLGSDAHHPEELAGLEIGLATAHLAGLAPDDLLACRNADAVVAWAAARRGRRADGRP